MYPVSATKLSSRRHVSTCIRMQVARPGTGYTCIWYKRGFTFRPDLHIRSDARWSFPSFNCSHFPSAGECLDFHNWGQVRNQRGSNRVSAASAFLVALVHFCLLRIFHGPQYLGSMATGDHPYARPYTYASSSSPSSFNISPSISISLSLHVRTNHSFPQILLTTDCRCPAHWTAFVDSCYVTRGCHAQCVCKQYYFYSDSTACEV